MFSLTSLGNESGYKFNKSALIKNIGIILLAFGNDFNKKYFSLKLMSMSLDSFPKTGMAIRVMLTWKNIDFDSSELT